jgi:hypothetical protein
VADAGRVVPRRPVAPDVLAIGAPLAVRVNVAAAITTGHRNNRTLSTLTLDRHRPVAFHQAGNPTYEENAMALSPRRQAVRLAGFALLVAVAGVGAPAVAAEAAPQPLGKTRFVVSIARVDPKSSANWVRLATYSFKGSTGEVFESHWHWSQREHVSRTSTGAIADNCVVRNCNVQTAHGFENPAPQSLHGAFTVTGDLLRITWDTAGTEVWKTTSTAAGALARLDLSSNTFGATHGFGYGSNAEWAANATPADLATTYGSLPMAHEYYLWKTNSSGTPYIDTSGPTPPLRAGAPGRLCGSGNCVGSTIEPDGAGPCADYRQLFYVARIPGTTDRRNALWHWCEGNAIGRGEYCYTGNSHVKPQLQIIDDSGRFHGWVGVEASLDQTDSIRTADDDIGVFRKTDV